MLVIGVSVSGSGNARGKCPAFFTRFSRTSSSRGIGPRANWVCVGDGARDPVFANAKTCVADKSPSLAKGWPRTRTG